MSDLEQGADTFPEGTFLSYAETKELFTSALSGQVKSELAKVTIDSNNECKRATIDVAGFINRLSAHNLQSNIKIAIKEHSVPGVYTVLLQVNLPVENLDKIGARGNALKQIKRVSVASAFTKNKSLPSDLEVLKKLHWYPVFNSLFRSSFHPSGGFVAYDEGSLLKLLTDNFVVQAKKADVVAIIAKQFAKMHNDKFIELCSKEPQQRYIQASKQVDLVTATSIQFFTNNKGYECLKHMLRCDSRPTNLNLAANLGDYICFGAAFKNSSPRTYEATYDKNYHISASLLNFYEQVKLLYDEFRVQGKDPDSWKTYIEFASELNHCLWRSSLQDRNAMLLESFSDIATRFYQYAEFLGKNVEEELDEYGLYFAHQIEEHGYKIDFSTIMTADDKDANPVTDQGCSYRVDEIQDELDRIYWASAHLFYGDGLESELDVDDAEEVEESPQT